MKAILALVSTVVIAFSALLAWQRVDGNADEISSLGLPTPATDVTLPGDKTALITVGEGDTARGIGEALEDAGVIDSARLFRALVGLMGLENDLGAGEYEFPVDTPVLTVIEQMRHGGGLTLRFVTIPEGLRLEEVAQKLEDDNVVTAKDFLAAVKDPKQYDYDFLEDLPKGASLEGYLFPATYDMPEDIDAEGVVNVMLQGFQDQLTDDMMAGFKKQKLSVHEAVTLASIVEREAVVPRERALIARVYLNRIDNDMLLQADPTTQYAVAEEDPAGVDEFGWWKQELTVDDLALDSPYNTYVSAGLPPGPIAAPGTASLEAVANPDDSDVLFFVACGDDGHHEFSATLAEHEANVARCQSGG